VKTKYHHASHSKYMIKLHIVFAVLRHGYKQIAANIRELYAHGTKPRSKAQIVAIAERTARGRKSKKKK
jgi:hypothetical protein